MLRKIIGNAGRVCVDLFEQLNVSQHEIAERFKQGDLPMGFSDNLLWKEIAANIKKLPSEFQEQEERITQLTKKETEISIVLEELKKQQQDLETELRSTQEEKINIQKKCQPWFTFKEKYDQVATFIDNCVSAEEQLATTLDQQLAIDPSALTAEMKGDAPLSLVFNAFGMSAASIKKLQFANGVEFLNHGFFFTCKNLDVSLGEQNDLAFLQQVLSNEKFCLLKQDHFDNCAVCNATTSQMFCELIVEHKNSLGEVLANPDIDLTELLDYVKQHNITGRQFLGAFISDFRTSFPKERIEEMIKILSYFKNIHLNPQHNCAVCNATTSQMFYDLIVEHKQRLGEALTNPDIDLTKLLGYVKQHNITGSQFLGSIISDFRANFPKERIEEMIKILSYFKNIHLKPQA